MLNRKARQLIGYDKLVTGLASVIQDEDLEYLETEDLKDCRLPNPHDVLGNADA